MIQRHLSDAVKRSARSYPVVTVTGPRQSGKTTLVRALFPKYAYVSLETPDQRAFALEDPRGFLNRFAGNAILDEVQRAPELFSYIQGRVDEKDGPGQFILSGSQNFLLLQRVSQSLAGRSAVFSLLPFSRAELSGRKLRRLENIGTTPARARGSRGDLFEELFKGFYPRIHDKDLDPQEWLRNYYQTYIERDVRSLVNVGDLEGFGRFVRLCAGRSGQLLNLSSLGADCGVTHSTAKRWLSVLEASYIVYLLRPHFRNFNKRLVKSPKLYFLDTGMLCYLLRIRSPEDLATHALRGAVFETFVVSELLKTYQNHGREPDVYFWRDSAGHEIDLLIDRGEMLLPIEIKSGETIASDFFKNLEFWRSLPNQAEAATAIVYGGEDSRMQRDANVCAWHDWP